MTRSAPATTLGDGVLLVDKPVGPTSHDVVSVVRRALRTRRVGHTGTLDPFASGLLLVCVNRATRLVEYLHGFDKEYVAIAELGRVTDTLDPEGEVVATHPGVDSLGIPDVASALTELASRTTQLPPVFSAKKVGGEAAHRRVRRGEEVELEPVAVTIHSLDLLSWKPPLVEFRARVSTGTYIRALARDLGEILDVGGHLRELRRTAIGPFSVDDAVSLDEIPGPGSLSQPAWLPSLEALPHLPQVAVDGAEAEDVLAGRTVSLAEDAGIAEGGPVAVSWEGRLLAVAEAGHGILHPRKVFTRD